MRVHYEAEYEGGVRTPLRGEEVTDEAEAYRRATALLRDRPLAHRVVVWSGWETYGRRYITRATRGVPVERTRETIAAEREGHGAGCFETCCMGTAKDRNEENTDG